VSWRREVEALIGTPSASPAVVVALAGRAVDCRLVGRASVPTLTAVARSSVDASVTARSAVTALPFADRSIAWLLVSFVGDASLPATRGALLAELWRVVAPDGTLVLVDHNRPRRLPAALVATMLPPRPPSARPAAAWRRLAYPTAREAHAVGFIVDRLRLAADERVQVVWTRHPRS